jgi:membrane-associated protease RseP (regulator of RpoE activity)
MKQKGIVILVALLAGAATIRAEPRGWLGVYSKELDPAMQAALSVSNGVILEDVVTSSPADKADLKVGDVILKVDSEEILTSGDLSDYVGSRPEKSVQVEYLRQGKRNVVTAQLGTRERQLELSLENLPVPKDVGMQVRPMVRSVIEDYLAEMRELRDQIAELRKELERLRKDLKRLEKK